MSDVRYAEVSLTYDGKDISADLQPYLKSFTFTDNAEGKADDVSITLEDRDGRWCGDWFPKKGATLIASIIAHSWGQDNQTQSLPCGKFEIDQIEHDINPSQVTIKAVSTLVSKPIRQELHTKAWENITLSSIAGDIANKNGMTLFFESSENPMLERRDQVQQSDLTFLSGLCADYGIAVKVTDKQIVCYNEAEYEEHSAVDTLVFGDGRIKTGKFTTKSSGTYKDAHVQYHNPIRADNCDGYATDPNVDTGQTLEINQRADNPADAEKIAKAKLRKANQKEKTAKFTLAGDLRYSAGQNITLSGFGELDGKYFIEKATHTVGTGGYVVSLDMRLGGSSKGKSKGKAKKQSSGPRLLADNSDGY